MIRRLVAGVAAVGVLAVGAAVAQAPPDLSRPLAQAQADSPPSVEASPPDLGATAQEPGGAQAGLPLREPPPRTLRAYWHVFIAFAVTWLLLFGYALTVGRRFGRLEEELRRLRS